MVSISRAFPGPPFVMRFEPITTSRKLQIHIPCCGTLAARVSGAARTGATKASPRSDHDSGGTPALEQHWCVRQRSVRYLVETAATAAIVPAHVVDQRISTKFVCRVYRGVFRFVISFLNSTFRCDPSLLFPPRPNFTRQQWLRPRRRAMWRIC